MGAVVAVVAGATGVADVVGAVFAAGAAGAAGGLAGGVCAGAGSAVMSPTATAHRITARDSRWRDDTGAGGQVCRLKGRVDMRQGWSA